MSEIGVKRPRSNSNGRSLEVVSEPSIEATKVDNGGNIEPIMNEDIESIQPLASDDILKQINAENQPNALSHDFFFKYPIINWIISCIKEVREGKHKKCDLNVIGGYIFGKILPTLDDQTSISLETVWDVTSLALKDAERLGYIASYGLTFYKINDKTDSIHKAKDKMTDAQIQMQMRYRRDLRIMEGWLYSPLYSNYIGMRVRRFFKGFGPSEGVIDSYLPPDLNDGIPYWHVIHDDNDEEDIDYEDLVKFRMYYLKNKQYSSSDEEGVGYQSKPQASNKPAAKKRRVQMPSTDSKSIAALNQSVIASVQGEDAATIESNDNRQAGYRSSERIRRNPKYGIMTYNERVLFARDAGGIRVQRPQSRVYSYDDRMDDENHDEDFDDDLLCDVIPNMLNIDEQDSDRQQSYLSIDTTQLWQSIPSDSTATSLGPLIDVNSTPMMWLMRHTAFESKDLIDIVCTQAKLMYFFVPGRIFTANISIDGVSTPSRELVCCVDRYQPDQSMISFKSYVSVYVPILETILDIDVLSCECGSIEEDIVLNLFYQAHRSSSVSTEKVSHEIKENDIKSDDSLIATAMKENTDDNYDLIQTADISSNINPLIETDQSENLSKPLTESNIQSFNESIQSYFSSELSKQWSFVQVFEILRQRIITKEELIQSLYQSPTLRKQITMRQYLDFYYKYISPIKDGNICNYIYLLRVFACADILRSDADNSFGKLKEEASSTDQTLKDTGDLVPSPKTDDQETPTADPIKKLWDAKATNQTSNLNKEYSKLLNAISRNVQSVLPFLGLTGNHYLNVFYKLDGLNPSSNIIPNMNETSIDDLFDKGHRFNLSSIYVETQSNKAIIIENVVALLGKFNPLNATNAESTAAFDKKMFETLPSSKIYEYFNNLQALEAKSLDSRGKKKGRGSDGSDQRVSSLIERLDTIDVNTNPVELLDGDDRVVGTYTNRLEAGKAMNIPPVDILKCCLNKKAHTFTLRWRFADRESFVPMAKINYRENLRKRYHSRLLEMYRRLNAMSSASKLSQDLETVHLRCPSDEVIATITKISELIPKCFEDSKMSSMKARDIVDYFAHASCDYTANDIYTAIQQLIDSKAIRRSRISHDELILKNPTPSDGKATKEDKSTSSNQDNNVKDEDRMTDTQIYKEKVALRKPISRKSMNFYIRKIVELIYMTSMSELSPQCIYDHLFILFHGSTLPSDVDEITYDIFEECLKLVIDLKYLDYHSTTDLYYLTEEGIVMLFAEKNESPSKMIDPSNTIDKENEKIVEDIITTASDADANKEKESKIHDFPLDIKRPPALMNSIAVEIRSDAVPPGMNSSSLMNHFPYTSNLLHCHVKQLASSATVERVIMALQATRNSSSVNGCTIEDIIVVLTAWNQSKGNKDVQKTLYSPSLNIPRTLLTLYARWLINGAVTQGKIKYDPNKGVYFPMQRPFVTAETITSVPNDDGNSTILIKMKSMRYMISEAIFRRLGVSGARVIEIVEYVMRMPALTKLTNQKVKASSLLGPVQESLRRGTEKGLYVYQAKDKRYQLSPSERLRTLRRLDVSQAIDDIITTIESRAVESSAIQTSS